MDILMRLEAAVDTLLDKNQKLQAENIRLSDELEQLSRDRSHLLSEVDRILARLENI